MERRLGIIGDACRMDVMVGAKPKKKGFHILNSFQSGGLGRFRTILHFEIEHPRIAITCVIIWT